MYYCCLLVLILWFRDVFAYPGDRLSREAETDSLCVAEGASMRPNPVQ